MAWMLWRTEGFHHFVHLCVYVCVSVCLIVCVLLPGLDGLDVLADRGLPSLRPPVCV